MTQIPRIVRHQPRLHAKRFIHVIVAGQVLFLPDIPPLAEHLLHSEEEREMLRAQQQQFLRMIGFQGEISAVTSSALDLRVAVRHRTEGSAQLVVAVASRATTQQEQEVEFYAHHQWNRLCTAFPSSYGFDLPLLSEEEWLSTLFPSQEHLEGAGIWELVKLPHPVRPNGILEIVGTYGELLDSMIASWNAIARSMQRVLLSVRCEPVVMTDALKFQLNLLYRKLDTSSSDPQMKLQDSPLVQEARNRLEHLLSTMHLMRMRVQVVSWDGEPATVLAAIKADLTTTLDMRHRNCECQWNKLLGYEKERGKDELTYLMIEEPAEGAALEELPETQEDIHPLLYISHELLPVAEASAAWRLPLARRYGIAGIPFKRDPLFTPEPLPLSQEGKAAILLGAVISRRGERPQQMIDANMLTRHTLIVGETGSGKSTTTQSIIQQLWQAGIPSLVIDPVTTEYRELWALSSAFRERPKSLCVFMPGAVGDVGTLLAFNPFCPQVGISLDSHIMTLKDCFGSAFALGEAWKELIGRALRSAYQHLGWLASDPERNREPMTASDIQQKPFPTLIDFVKATEKEIVQYKTGEFRSNTEAGLLGRLRDLAAGPLGALIHTRRALNVAKLVERPVVIELHAIRQPNAKSLIMLFLLTQLRQYYDTLPRERGLKHLVVVEEAHRLLSPSPLRIDMGSDAQEGALHLMTDMLAELRKLGIGMVLVEQLPSRLDETVVKLPGVKVLHRLSARDDREMLAHAMNMTPEQTKYVTTLSTGEAAFYAEGLTEPVLVQVANPWGPEMNPMERLPRPESAKEQEALGQEVKEHALQVWPAPTERDAPWNPCRWCKCGCRPRMRLLEGTLPWWEKIDVNEVVDKLIQERKRCTKEGKRIDSKFVSGLAKELWAQIPPGTRDEQRCGLTLACERYVHLAAAEYAEKYEGTDYRQMLKTIEESIDLLLDHL